MAKEKTPIEQAIWEMEYQILMRGVEVELLQDRLKPLRGELMAEDNRKKINELNEVIMALEKDISVYNVEINYYKEKLSKIKRRNG